MSNTHNTSPMLLLTKSDTSIYSIPPCLCCIFDLCEHNTNTIKFTSLLPDMDEIFCCITSKHYRSALNGKNAYECIYIESDHMKHTAMTTPDGNMVSLVLQQSDCNAVVTYQTLMNHLFRLYIGVWLEVYLDDILIYSDTLEEHVAYIKTVVDIIQ